MLEIIFKSIRGVFINKGRMLLTLLGIAVGVAAVIITNNIGDCGKTALTGEIDGLGMGGLAVSPNKDSTPLTMAELEDIKSLPYVSTAMPLVFETTNVYFQDKQKPIYLFGIDQTADKSISLSLLYGRFFNSGDIAANSKICMVDQKFAADNYGTDNIVGKTIMINSGDTTDKYSIIGILKTGSGLLQNVIGNYIPDFVYIPYSTMQNNMSSNNFTQIVIKTNEFTDYDAAEKDIVKRMERQTNIKDGYTVNNLAKQKESLNNILSIFSVVLSAIGAISLLVAGLNIMNVMLVSVAEQTREIGIKKSLGASRGSIVVEFLAKSAFISLIGCFLGIAVGTVLSIIGAGILGLTLNFRADIMIVMIVFSALIGTFFGIYPAVKAASLKPVDALRYY